MIKNGLSDAQSNVMDEIVNTFPGFGEAFEWLKEQIDRGKVSKKEPQTHFGPEARKRDALITKFEEFAISNSGDSYEEFGYWDDSNGGLDSDDSDYGEQMDIRQPDLSRSFVVWATALCEWPHKREAEKLWHKLKSSDDDENLLLSVDGIADSLASR